MASINGGVNSQGVGPGRTREKGASLQPRCQKIHKYRLFCVVNWSLCQQGYRQFSWYNMDNMTPLAGR